jgi:hypothetical protein
MEYLIPIGILALLGLMAFLLTRSNKNTTNLLQELAKQENWEYTKKNGTFDGLFEFKGQLNPEQSWTLTAFDRASENRLNTSNLTSNVSGPYTEWSISLPSIKAELFMMPKDPSMKMVNEEKLLQMLKPIWRSMGLNADQWMQFKSSDSDIQNAYLLMSDHPELAQKLFSSAFEENLKPLTQFNFGSRPAFRIQHGKAEVQIRKVLRKPEEIKDLVRLGIAFSETCTK